MAGVHTATSAHGECGGEGREECWGGLCDAVRVCPEERRGLVGGCGEGVLRRGVETGELVLAETCTRGRLAEKTEMILYAEKIKECEYS